MACTFVVLPCVGSGVLSIRRAAALEMGVSRNLLLGVTTPLLRSGGAADSCFQLAPELGSTDAVGVFCLSGMWKLLTFVTFSDTQTLILVTVSIPSLLHNLCHCQ